jgi:formate dehydrogenase iron-sulfur subunit
VPKYEWDRAIPVVRKCIMCIDRIRGGKPTACAEACPEGATLFGKRDELLKTAKERISANPEDYYNYIYGEHEAGGTSVFFLAKNDFRTMGFNMDIFREPYENFTWWIMSRIPSFVLVWGAFLAGIWWLTNRKNRIAEELSEKDKEDK